MDAATRSTRIEALRKRMGDAGIDLVALAPSDNLRYVVGGLSRELRVVARD